MVVGGNGLTFHRIEVFQLGLGNLAGALGIDISVDHGDRKISQDRLRQENDVEFIGTKLVEREALFIFLSEQDIALFALGKRHR